MRQNIPFSDRLSEPSPDNASSWEWTVAYFEYLTSDPNKGRFLPLLRLVRQLAAGEYAQSFRAGQSAWNLCISTATQNGLRIDEPRVVVTLGADDAWIVQYYKGAEVSDLLESYSCSQETLLPVVTEFLQRLWKETRGGEEPGLLLFDSASHQAKRMKDA